MVTIEPLSPGDFDSVARWLSNPEINRWLSEEWRGRQVTASIVAVAVRNRRNRLYLTRCDGMPAGLVALSEIEADDRTAMVWYLLGERELGGQGVVTQAVAQLARLAFTENGMVCLYAWAMEPNSASRRVLEKVGFREVGRIRCASRLGEVQVDRVYFDLLPSDEAMRR